MAFAEAVQLLPQLPQLVTVSSGVQVPLQHPWPGPQEAAVWQLPAGGWVLWQRPPTHRNPAQQAIEGEQLRGFLQGFGLGAALAPCPIAPVSAPASPPARVLSTWRRDRPVPNARASSSKRLLSMPHPFRFPTIDPRGDARADGELFPPKSTLGIHAL